MSLFTRTFPYAGLIDVHSNAGWHIKISRKRQIFMSYYNTSAVDRLRKPEFLIDVSKPLRLIVDEGVYFCILIFNCNFQFRLLILNSNLNFKFRISIKIFYFDRPV